MNHNKAEVKQIHILIPKKMWDRIKREAKRKGLSSSAEIRIVLDAHYREKSIDCRSPASRTNYKLVTKVHGGL